MSTENNSQSIALPPFESKLGGVALNKFAQPKIMLAIQGPGGSGKSTSAITFPNPVVGAFEVALEEHRHRSDVIEIQFYNPDVISKWDNGKFKPHATRIDDQTNIKDAFLYWLKNEGLKIPAGYTFVLDSWSSMQDGFDIYTNAHPEVTKKGSEDGYAFWADKVDYSRQVMGFLYSMKCHVVVLFHEIQTRDPKTGQLLEKIKPLMQGQFHAQLKRYFPYFYRMINEETKERTTGNEISCEYFWQIKSSNAFDAKTGFKNPNVPFKIKPTYEAFLECQKAYKTISA